MKRRAYGWPALLASVALLGYGAWGCVGDIGATPDEPELEPGDFACAPGDPSAVVLARLTRDQYVASLHAFAASELGEAEADAIIDSLATTLTLLPQDGSVDHDRLDQAVSQAHVDAQYYLAVAFATAATSTPARLEALMGSCATDADTANDDACLEAFVRTFGYRAHRKPISDDDLSFYRDDVFFPANGLELAAIRDVIGAMLLSPHFVYRVETDGEPVGGRDDLFQLSAHELASRLAFHFWDSPPDEALYAAADSGALLTEDGFAAEVDRLVADPRTQATLDGYMTEWLWLEDLAPLHQQVGQPVYDAFVAADVPTEELRARVIEDTLDLTRHVTWRSEGTFADLFLSDLSFAKTADVAALYGGVPLWQEGTEPQALPAGTRAGVLTRPAMLATGAVNTHPVLRGREVRRRIMCQEMPAPPADAMDDLPVVDPITTTRGYFETVTEQPGSSCVACHGQMNPIGYTLEGYDGLGRMRSNEILFNEDGTVLASLPIDTAAVPALEGGDDTEANDGVDLSALVAESNLARACFARHYFRFTFGRLEDDGIDGCELEKIRDSLAEGRSLKQVFRDIAMSPTFRLRKLSD